MILFPITCRWNEEGKTKLLQHISTLLSFHQGNTHYGCKINRKWHHVVSDNVTFWLNYNYNLYHHMWRASSTRVFKRGVVNIITLFWESPCLFPSSGVQEFLTQIKNRKSMKLCLLSNSSLNFPFVTQSDTRLGFQRF